MGHVIRVENFKFAVSRQLSPKIFFNKATCQILVKKLMKEYLVQETEILNQLLGKWEKS